MMNLSNQHDSTLLPTWLWSYHLISQRIFSSVKLEKEMAVHSIILAWRIPWTEESDSLQSMRSQRVGHNWSDLAWHKWGRYLLHRIAIELATALFLLVLLVQGSFFVPSFFPLLFFPIVFLMATSLIFNSIIRKEQGSQRIGRFLCTLVFSFCYSLVTYMLTCTDNTKIFASNLLSYIFWSSLWFPRVSLLKHFLIF